MIKSIVLNLHRRPDRLERFKKFYEDSGPDIPLEVFTAIDGSDPTEFERVPIAIKNRVSNDNDYENRPSVRATAMGHMMIWQAIIDEGLDYALIFEDDCYFRPDNKLLPRISGMSMKEWNSVINEYSPKLSDRKNILYFGVGDILPIHTVPPSESILIAQERNHVHGKEWSYYGKPNFNSAYVFDWVGCSSYVISNATARYLLAISAKQPIKYAVDSWIKRLSNNKIVNLYFSVPLFTYTPGILDSNTAFPELSPPQI